MTAILRREIGMSNIGDEENKFLRNECAVKVMESDLMTEGRKNA